MPKHISADERIRQENRINLCLGYLYIINVFSYSIAIVLLSYQEYINYDGLPNSYEQLMRNWEQSYIINFNNVLVEEFTYDESNQQIQITPNVINQFNNFQRANYTFSKNYNLHQYCGQDEQVCGGYSDNNKICVKNNLECPQTNILSGVRKEGSLSTYYDCVYKLYFLWLCNSTFYDSQPIVKLQFSTTEQLCYGEPFQGACKNQLLGQYLLSSDYYINQTQYYLIAVRYINIALSCRKDLMIRLLEGENYYTDKIGYYINIQSVFTLVYCIFIGLCLNMLHFIIMQDDQALNFFQYSSLNALKYVRRGILVIRFVVFIPYGVIICLLYFYEAQMDDTLVRSIQQSCFKSDEDFVVKDTQVELNNLRQYQKAVFGIFIFALCLELFSLLCVLYRSTTKKKQDKIIMKLETDYEKWHEKQMERKSQASTPLIRTSFNPQFKQILQKNIQEASENIEYGRDDNVLDQMSEDYQYKKKESHRPVWKEPEEQQYGNAQTPNRIIQRSPNFRSEE